METVTTKYKVLRDYVSMILLYQWDPLQVSQYFAKDIEDSPIATEAFNENDDLIVIHLSERTNVRLKYNTLDDEYNDYIGTLMWFIRNRSSVREIYAYLRHVEVRDMQVKGNKVITRDIAERIHDIGWMTTIAFDEA